MANANYTEIAVILEKHNLEFSCVHSYGSNGRGCVTDYTYYVKDAAGAVLACAEYRVNAMRHPTWPRPEPGRAHVGKPHDFALSYVLSTLKRNGYTS
jgi:hypothetical protein